MPGTQNTKVYRPQGGDSLVVTDGGEIVIESGGKIVSSQSMIHASYFFTGAPAATDQVFFIADRAMKVVSVRQVHAVAAGGTSTLDVNKETGTEAPGAGTALTTAAFNLNATANTVQSGTLAADAVLTLAAGDRLAVDFNHAIQSTAGLVVTVALAPL